MKYRNAIVFGFNEFARQIAIQIKDEYDHFSLFVMNDEEYNSAVQEGFLVERFDLSEEWESIEKRFDLSSLIVFCALEDDAENVFLTISLRSVFWDLPIIALSGDYESSAKLKSAGANKVMPKLQITANVITEMLEKPTVTEVLHNILYEESSLKIAQITIPEGSFLVGRYLHDIDFSKEYGLLVLAVVDHAFSATFSFTSKGHNHHIDPEDVIVVIGYDDKISALKAAIEGNT